MNVNISTLERSTDIDVKDPLGIFDVNQQFAYYLYDLYKAQILIDNQGILYVNTLNNLFDEFRHIGPTKTYMNKLRKLTVVELEQMKSEYIKNLYRNTAPDLSHIKNFNELLSRSSLEIILKSTKSLFLKQIQGNKINLISLDGQEKILLICDELGASNVSLDIIEDTYVTLSKIGMTPFVHEHGQISVHDYKYMYLITDYVPTTLGDITESKLKNKLLKRALIITYAIYGLGYCNQDLHDENFLYDEATDKLYAIDFTDIMLCSQVIFQYTKYEPTIYLNDIDRRVTVDEILNGVY